MLAKSSKDIQPPGSRQSQEAESGHPVIRTLYDHFEVIISNGDIIILVYVCCGLVFDLNTVSQYIRLPNNNKAIFLKTPNELNEKACVHLVLLTTCVLSYNGIFDRKRCPLTSFTEQNANRTVQI